MSFDINTNVASLQAQNYLRTNSNFQSKTISQVTSGLRIVQAGDDAAGLAVANGMRSDEAVLTQGIANANNGLSQLQIIDGGMSNISQLLDRARTLATESASSAFTGDRGVLNTEFQNVIGEVDRQAQAVGMNTGGQFAKSLSIFVGGGSGATGAAAVQNGSVSLDLSQATVDAKSLGLQGVQAAGVAGTDIGAGSSATSVAKVLADANNQKSATGYTDFVITGPGFSGASGITLKVNLSGVTDATTLATAVNAAIQTAGSASTPQATAFKNANITAAINTDSSNHQQLTFGSSSTTFQVAAGDQMANALMGNFGSQAVMAGTAGVGNSFTTTGASDDYLTMSFNGGPAMNFHIGTVVGITGGTMAADLNAISAFSANATASWNGTTQQMSITAKYDTPGSTMSVSNSTLATALALSGTATATATTGKSLGESLTVNAGATGTTSLVGSIVQFSGGGLASPVNITLSSAATSYANAQADLVNQVNANAALQAAGINVTAGTTSLTFTNNSGQSFSVSSSGDVSNSLGLGNYVKGANNAYQYTTITGGASLTGATTDKLEISVAGGPAQEFSVTGAAGATGGTLASLINAQIAGNATLMAAGIQATGASGVGGAITLASSNGTLFRVAEGDGTSTNQILGFGSGTESNTLTAGGNAGVKTTTATSQTNNFTFNAGGSSATKVFQFSNIQNAQDAQTVSISANDASGSAHSLAVVLQNTATAQSGASLDQSIAAINSALQSSNDSTLQSIVAVKSQVMNSNGTVAGAGIQFLSSLAGFSVSMSAAGTGGTVGIGTAAQQGVVQNAATLAGGGTADVSNLSTAQNAVTALANATQALGSAQAAVGRGENLFGYATSLAQSQLTNLAAAEAQIRDADLASESANLTKAQILVQAGVAALAQANSAPQQVLTLLRG